MSVAELVAAGWADILRIAESHGASNVRVFGSVARGTAGPESDLDLLVDLESGRTLFDLVAIQQDLEEFLGRRVDVVTEAGLSPYLRDAILRDEPPLSRDTIRLLRIRDAIARVESYTAIGKEQFFADSVYQDAVIRQLEVIGELTNRTSVALRE